MRFNFISHLGASTRPETMLALAGRAADYGWHVVLHFAPADLVALAPRLSELPCPYVIDHFGRIEARGGLEQPAFQTVMRLLEDDRCWVKISAANRVSDQGPPYDGAIPYARAIVDAAPDRTLWGSDWPHPNVTSPPDTGDLLAFLADVAEDEEQRRRILVDNPARLYRFDAAPQ